MDEKRILLNMLKALLRDLQEIQQKGAGYYSCAPFVQRYNKLLEKAKVIFAPEESLLLDTFSRVEDTTSVDPADKMKVTQHIVIEGGQLIAYIEASLEGGEGTQPPEPPRDEPPSVEKAGR